jgi:hypothetical protein
MLNVPSGQSQVEPHTASPFNMANADVALRYYRSLIQSLVMPGYIDISEVKILTLYNAQSVVL